MRSREWIIYHRPVGAWITPAKDNIWLKWRHQCSVRLIREFLPFSKYSLSTEIFEAGSLQCLIRYRHKHSANGDGDGLLGLALALAVALLLGQLLPRPHHPVLYHLDVLPQNVLVPDHCTHLSVQFGHLPLPDDNNTRYSQDQDQNNDNSYANHCVQATRWHHILIVTALFFRSIIWPGKCVGKFLSYYNKYVNIFLYNTMRDTVLVRV